MSDVDVSALGIVFFLLVLLVAMLPSFLLWQYLIWRRLSLCNANFHIEQHSLSRHLLWLLSTNGQIEHLSLSIGLLIIQLVFYSALLIMNKNSLQAAIAPMSVALPISALLPIASIWLTFS